MDSRRYDKNADQLSQIIFHYTALKKTLPFQSIGAHQIADEIIELLAEALHLNDNMGQFVAQGLVR